MSERKLQDEEIFFPNRCNGITTQGRMCLYETEGFFCKQHETQKSKIMKQIKSYKLFECACPNSEWKEKKNEWNEKNKVKLILKECEEKSVKIPTLEKEYVLKEDESHPWQNKDKSFY
jgi:hypothetical protein